MDSEKITDQTEGANESPMAGLTNEKSFEEHQKDLEIENTLAEMNDEDASIETSQVIIDASAFRKKVRDANGELVDRKESEQYSIWKTAKDFAAKINLGTSQEEKRELTLKLSVLNELWRGESLDAQTMHTASLLANESEELLNTQNNDRIYGFVKRLGCISSVRSDMRSRSREYREYKEHNQNQ